MSSEPKMETSISNPELSAFAPDKEAWKRAGNFYSAEELQRMENDDVTVYQTLEKVLIAD